MSTDAHHGDSDTPNWDAVFDVGYGQGYSAGHNWAVEQLIGWLDDEGFTDAAKALRYFLSPEGIEEQNRKLREVYGSLQRLAEKARAES